MKRYQSNYTAYLKLLPIALVFGLIAWSVNECKGQIKIVKDETVLVGELGSTKIHKAMVEDAPVYFFSYRDMQYQSLVEIKSFSFEDVDSTFNNLYKIISEGFVTIPKEDVILELPRNQRLYLSYTKVLGVVNLKITHFDGNIMGIVPYITKKQLAKLFGKQ
jgi:hypothetical protein